MEIGGMIDTFIESEDVHREPLHVLVTAKVTPARLDEMRLTAEAAAMRQEDPAGELYPAGWYVLLRTGLCERGE